MFRVLSTATLGGQGDGPEVKKQRWVQVSQLFLCDSVALFRTEDNVLLTHPSCSSCFSPPTPPPPHFFCFPPLPAPPHFFCFPPPPAPPHFFCFSSPPPPLFYCFPSSIFYCFTSSSSFLFFHRQVRPRPKRPSIGQKAKKAKIRPKGPNLSHKGQTQPV